MSEIRALPNEILVAILKAAGPATATIARRVSKQFNSLVEKHGLGKHCCDDLVIKWQNSLFSVTLKRQNSEGTLKPMSFEVEQPYLDQSFKLLSDKLVYSVENLIIVGCVVDTAFLKLISHLCSLLKYVDSFHNRICIYQCSDEEFGNFIAEHRFSRFDCSLETQLTEQSVITNETFVKYMPSTLVFLQTNTKLNDQFLKLLVSKKPKTFQLEDSRHQITFYGLTQIIRSMVTFPDCSWSFGFVSTRATEPFLEFMETLKELSFEQTILNRGYLHYQFKKDKFVLCFKTGNLRQF